MIPRVIKIAAIFFVFIFIVAGSAYLTLTLIIKSEDTVVVPDLIGKDVVYVLELLTDLGLNTKVEGSEYSNEVPKNNVILQDPEPGSEIKKERDVRIILSKGPKFILMPNLEGLSVQQARIILEENSLCLGKISSTYNSIIKKETVIAQAPTPETVTIRGECVDLLVSKGIRPRAYKMPDLRGVFLDRAILLVENKNLVLGAITSIFNEEKPLNTIVDQKPLSGHRIAEGSTVSLVVNRKPGVKEPGYLPESQEGSLFRYRLKDGFLKRHIRIVLNSFGVSNVLFESFMKPGEDLWLIIPRHDHATLFLYEDGELVKTQVFEAG